MKKIPEIIQIVLAILVLIALTIYEIGSGMLKSCAYAKYVYGDEYATENIATSQEIKEINTVKEVESTKATPTGTVSVHSVGMATTVESISESVAATCQWNKTVELTQSELELLYTTVYCESGDQELEAQIMVAQTIINRMISDKYPNMLRGVVYQRNTEGKPQFAVINWPDFEKRGWTDDTMTAVHYALSHKGYPEDMLYFRDSHYHDFGQPYKNVEDMYFSLAE